MDVSMLRHPMCRHALRRLAACALAAAALAAPGPARAQNANPDISLIGDMRAFVTRQKDSDDPKNGKLQLNLESVEFALGGYLNPYVRGDVFAAYTDAEGFTIEEAFATVLRGLPAGLQVRAGRFRTDFGKLNLLHPHAYSFLDTPLAHRLYLGEEGMMDTGVNVNAAFPVGNLVVTPSVNLLKGDFAKHVLDTPDGETAIDRDPTLQTKLATSERLSVFVPTGDYAGFEAGVNALQGALDSAPHPERTVRLIGADLKYRWAPDKYRSLTVQGEWIRSTREVPLAGEFDVAPLGKVTASGFYAFADYRFKGRWNAGAIVERAGSPVDASLTYRRAGAFVGFAVMEETTLFRLLVRRTDSNAVDDRPVNEAVLQMIFSLGPHKAHWF